MTGGGASSVAFVKEDSFKTLPGTPTYYLPGRDPTVEEVSLSNTLTRLREPDTAEAVDTLAGNLEGSLSVSWGMSNDTHQHVRDIVFNDGGTGFTSGHAASSRWYLGAEYLDGTGTSVQERELIGCVPLEYSISYEQGTQSVRESLTLGYTDEERNTSFTPSSVTRPTNNNDVPFHGTSLNVDGASVDLLQSATLSFSNLSRFQRGPDRSALDATLAAPEVSLDATAIYGGPDYQNLAYGGAGTSVTTIQDSVDPVTATLDFAIADGTTVASYALPQVAPDSYDWSDLVSADTDLTDPVSYTVSGSVTIA